MNLSMSILALILTNWKEKKNFFLMGDIEQVFKKKKNNKQYDVTLFSN